MLNVNVICVGKMKEIYFGAAVKEYEKRLSRFCNFRITELEEAKLPEMPSDAQIETALLKESKIVTSKIRPGAAVVAMCIEGKLISSEELSKTVDGWKNTGTSEIDFIIGSSYGMSDTIKNAARLKLSMSPMTFPHRLARVMLCEQIYRAFSIANNGKYHK